MNIKIRKRKIAMLIFTCFMLTLFSPLFSISASAHSATNLALGKDASSKSYTGTYYPSYTTDGSTTSGYCAMYKKPSDPTYPYLQVDLGSSYYIDGFGVLFTGNNVELPGSYEIQGSNSPASGYTTIATKSSVAVGACDYDITAAGPYQYIRLQVTSIPNTYASIYEFYVYGASDSTLTYSGNSNTEGSAPSSVTAAAGSNVTVAGNTGGLARTGYAFAGWNTMANGTGTNYAAGSTINMNALSITLYAKWITPNPTGALSVNAGSAVTNNGNAALTISGVDPLGLPLQMRFSNDGSTWSDWETYATSKSWPLAASDGSKTVYMQLKNNNGDVSSNITDSIVLDSTAPSGAGTLASPYLIATVADLQWLSQKNTSYSGFSGQYFQQTANIDISSIASWTPIGDSTNKFAGSYDGNGFSVDGLKLTSGSFAGLFGYNQGTIRNLGVTNVNIANPSGNCVGALVGYNTAGTITSCYSTGTVSGGSRIGGLIGYAANVNMSNCFSTCTVTASSGEAGGLFGMTRTPSLIKNCYAAGNVTGPASTGAAAGIAGYADVSVTVTNCFSTCTLSGLYMVGIVPQGLSLTGCQTTSAKLTWDAGTYSNCTTGRAASYFKTQSNFADSSWSSSSPWDFTNTWVIDPSGTINNGYPYLKTSQLAPAPCKVTFNSNGGSSVTEQNIVSGSKATEPSLPTKAGCIFGGWYTDSKLTQAFNFNTPITSAITLYARWDAIFADFFNSATGKWATSLGTWGITSGEYVQSPKGGIEAFSLAGESSWTDYTFEADVKIISGGANDAGIVFRATNENNMYMLAVRTGGVELYSRVSGNWNTLQSASAAITNDTWYHYKIVLKASNIKVYFNNSTTALIDKTDSAFASGKIGLRTNNTVANFDNVVVYDPSRTVAFDSNGGSAVTSLSVEFGNTASAPASPTKSGYTFVGWFTDNTTFKNAFSFSTPITDSITLYAKWTEDSYCVSYDGNGSTAGDVPGAKDYYNNETVTVLGNAETTPLSKTGYTFAGWNTATDGTGTPYAPGATFKMGTSPVTLYAQWTINSYKLEYDPNGGSGDVPASSTTHNYSSEVTVLGNVGTIPLAKTGYTFGGWNTAADGKGTGYSTDSKFNMPGNDVKLYAVWNVNTYSVSYDGNGNTGGAAPAAANYNYSATVTILGNVEPTPLSRTGYTFSGWNTKADGTGAPYAPNATFSMGTGNVTLYAVWTKNNYTLAYNANGKTALTIPTGGTKSYGSEIEVGAKATAAGYTFIEWNTKSNGSGTTYLPTAKFSMPAGDVTLYAIWETNKYTVSYDGNGNTGGTVPADGEFAYNSEATASANTNSLVRTGYSFAGWNTQADGMGTPYAAGAKFTLGSSDVTLYAQWTINSYNVIYYGNGNNGGAVPSDADAHVYNLPVSVLGNTGSLTKTGYTFGGWNTSPDGKGSGYVKDSVFNMPGDHVKLYAVWNVNTYSVSYDGNGNTAGTVPEAISYNYNASVTVADNTGTTALSRTGYEFAGWSTTPSGTAEYLGSTGKNSFTLGAGNVTLYAVWKLKSFTVTYDANVNDIDSGTVPTDSVAHDYSSSVTVLGNTGSLVRSGYVFGGWNTSEFGTGTGYSAGSKFNMPGQDVTLYAVWNSGNYTVFYNGNGNTGGTAPSSQMDSYKSSIILQTNSGNLSKTGYNFAGWNTKSDGKGTAYAAGASFTIPKNNTILYAVWTPAVGGYDIPSSGNTNVYVDGNAQNNAGSSTTTTGSNGQTTTTVTLNENRMTEILKGLPDNGGASGKSPVVSIPVTNTDAMVGVLTGQMVKDMEKKDVTLEIKTDAATYTLPADQIKIDAVSQQMGQDVKLSDIKVQVEIAKTDSSAVKVVEDSAIKGNFTIVVPPVSFNITCTYSGKTAEVSQFNSYVERTVAIPDGVDPAKITTGVIVDSNGNARHVPTMISVINGKYYAQIRSLTNSTYAVVYHPVEFKDVTNHWAKDAVNDMGSRLVISGVGDNMFEPDRSITRAEFAAIVVRALGLKPGTGNNPFTDVRNNAWYCDYVKTAAEYKLISGYGEGKFGPDDKITREQAMTMIARAMSITGLNTELSSADAEKLLAAFKDSNQSAAYAKGSVAACIKTGIVSGRDDLLIAPKDNITRAEVAVIVRRLLQKSGLI